MIRINVFPGVQHLAIFAGQAKGLFSKHGLKVELQFTQNSQTQRDGLAKGLFEIAHAAVDNAVAMVEMTGADVVIVMGGDRSMNQLFVQPHIRSVAGLKGKTVIVDALNTAYALQIKKILLMSGLREGQDYRLHSVGGTHKRLEAMRENKDYAASMLFPPYSILAAREGLRSLGLAVKLIGSYQDNGAFVLRRWAQANAATLEQYIEAYVDSLRWALSAANKNEAVRLLAEQLKLPLDIAEESYDHALESLAQDARFDVEGFRNVLALRAEIESQWGGRAPAPEKYFDLTYYQRALAALGKRRRDGQAH